jgi:hypothetical protein
MSDQFVHDQLMHDKGYRYRLTPIGNAFEPLYTKTLGQIGPLMRDYKDTRFEVKAIVYDWKLADLFQLWKDDKHTEVINILGEDHPGLVAAFIAQGIADKRITRSDVNEIANLLIEKRIKLAQE